MLPIAPRFQGLERFHEQGLPCELPVDRREFLKQDPHVRYLEQEVRSLKALQADRATINETKRRLSRYRSSLEQKALHAYQEEWVRTQRKLKILNRGNLFRTADSMKSGDGVHQLFAERVLEALLSCFTLLHQRFATECPLILVAAAEKFVRLPAVSEQESGH